MPKKPRGLVDELLPDDVSRLRRIREFAGGLWAKDAVQHPFFTLHGPGHSEQIEEIINDILALELTGSPSLEIIDPTQSFYLLASVWLHDTGMLVPPTDSERKAAEGEGIPIEDYIRREHHRRSRQYVEGHAEGLWLEQFEADIIGAVCEAHRETRLTDLPGTYPNLRLLGALIRAADQLDVTRARAPLPLMEQLWKNMDSKDRWHWVKHYCVAKAKPCHEVLRDGTRGPLFQLTYQYQVCLPEARLLAPFKDQLMQPIREVLETQNVNLILQTGGITVGFHHFDFTPRASNEVLFDQVRLGECVNALLPVPVSLPFTVLTYIEALRLKNPPAAAMLEMYCQRFGDAAFRLPHGCNFECAVIKYIDALGAAANLKAIEAAYDSFRRKCRGFLKGSMCGESERPRIQEAYQMAGWIAWRLASLATGDEAAGKLHLTSVIHRLGPEANDLLRWTKDKDPSVSVRQLAASALAPGAG